MAAALYFGGQGHDMFAREKRRRFRNVLHPPIQLVESAFNCGDRSGSGAKKHSKLKKITDLEFDLNCVPTVINGYICMKNIKKQAYGFAPRTLSPGVFLLFV